MAALVICTLLGALASTSSAQSENLAGRSPGGSDGPLCCETSETWGCQASPATLSKPELHGRMH
jgi:hypothetical protein